MQLWKFIIFRKTCFSSLLTILLGSVHIKYITRPAIQTRCWWGRGIFLFSIFVRKATPYTPYPPPIKQQQQKNNPLNKEILWITSVIILITYENLIYKRKKLQNNGRFHCWYFRCYIDILLKRITIRQQSQNQTESSKNNKYWIKKNMSYILFNQ